ncbi:hypothetical protein HJC23_000978 [Cyclotella cryptica]|uniref:PHD-type domain-containing protein n=1 Tax=Cyclotella cryptica TaxID=29204 RepID=A0ABD3QU79_9STRA
MSSKGSASASRSGEGKHRNGSSSSHSRHGDQAPPFETANTKNVKANEDPTKANDDIIDDEDDAMGESDPETTPRRRPNAADVPSPTSRFGHYPKYTKPKIGPMYQCAVPKFVPSENVGDADGGTATTAGSEAHDAVEEGSAGEDSVMASSSSVGVSGSGSGTVRSTSGRGGRGRGRSGRGRGRGGRGRASSGIGSAQEASLEILANGEVDAITMANAAAEHLQDNYGKRIIPRGGICIHRPHPTKFSTAPPQATPTNHSGSLAAPPLDQQEEFLTFSRNMFLQTPRPVGDFNFDDIWDSDAERTFGGRPDASSSGQQQHKKKSSKRKATSVDGSMDDCESLRSSAPSSSAVGCESEGLTSCDHAATKSCTESGSTTSILPLCGLEDDEHMLLFLQATHRGDFQKAKLAAMVNVDRGYGVHRRKAQRKKHKEECTYTDPTTFTSESWRWRLHQARPLMLGDLRANQNTSYQYFTSSWINPNDLASSKLPWRYQRVIEGNEHVDQSKPITRTRSGSIDWSQDQIEKAKRIWKAILSFTNDVLGKMDDFVDPKNSVERNAARNLLTDDNPRPLLPDLLVLVTKAHALPTPEETFGRRDPSARVMSQNMNAIIDAIEMGRDCAAQLLLLLKDDGDGIELPTLQSKALELEQNCPVKIPEMDAAKKLIHEASLWEEKLQNNVDCDADSDISDGEVLLEKKLTLEKVERLVTKGKKLTLRPRSLVRLESRVERAHVLRRKIIVWNEARNQENPQNIKFISGLIKEANKIDLMFPEILTLTGVHKKAEEWMDRASIAVRSTISFEELESLVSTGEGLPLDVSELLEKLQARIKQAREWMDRVNSIVPEHEDKFVWLKRIRSALNDRCDNSQLVSLVSDGSRIPVDMDSMKLLQIEIDARNWTMKCMPWIPKSSESSDDKTCRRGKIDDVKDHLDKASTIRDRLWFGTDEEKLKWVLDGEEELAEIVQMAQTWFEKYDVYLSQDNRNKKSRISMPLARLQTIVHEANQIPLNLGNPSTKISRIFSQAEEWVGKYYHLLNRCGIECSYVPSNIDTDSEFSSPVKIDMLHEAVSEADSELSVDLEEVIRLKEVLQRTQSWIEKVSTVSSKKNVMTGKKKRASNSIDDKHSMEEIAALIDEASTIPIDISDELSLLKIEQSKVVSWRLQMQRLLKEIILSFDSFSEKGQLFDTVSDDAPPPAFADEGSRDSVDVVSVGATRHNVTRQQSRSSSFGGDDTGASGVATPLSTDVTESNNFPLVANFLRSAKSINVLVPEFCVADELSGVMSWLAKSFKFLSSHAEAFDRKNSSTLDKLIKSGQTLLRFKSSIKEIPEDPKLLEELRERWASVLNDDLDKLVDLKDKRSKFFEWCEKADEIISDSDTKIPIETLQKLDDECLSFPSTCVMSIIFPRHRLFLHYLSLAAGVLASEVVIRVRQRTKDSLAWLKTVQDIMNSGNKISMEDAKKIIDKGEKLNLTCHELKTLRSALRTTKGWVTRVKKCGAENGETAVANVNELINEHKSFLVTAIDEVDKLKQATCGYCICRLPYEGFMIGCDGCEEWYHGPCVGVTEEQASKFDKYVCLRCSALRIYKENATMVAGILRKWSSSKCLAKSRLMDSQRFARKVRTCEKDLAKAKENLEKWEQSKCAAGSNGAEGCGDMVPTHVSFPNGEPSTSGATPKEELLNVRTSGEPSTGGGKVVVTSKSGNDLQDKIEKARTTIENCEKRLEGYKTELAERSSLEKKETSLALKLKTWCRMVKSDVVSPKTKEEAELSRPRSDSHTSIPIEKAKLLASTLGIVEMPDVSIILNSFKIFSWCLHLLEVLMRKPTVDEIRALLVMCDSNSFKFPESKCVRMLRSISSRAQIWQAKVKKALMADNKTSKPYDLGLLRELLLSAKQIPLMMPEEARLWSTIEDKGCRHCICGGPSDGSFMLCCDNCDKWFHGSCMKLDKAASDSITKWICPPCLGKGSEQRIQVNGAKVPAYDKPPTAIELNPQMQHTSPHAPDPATLWPPFGLRNSSHAVEALGKIGESDNEDFVQDDAALASRKDPPLSKSSCDAQKSQKDKKFLTSVSSFETLPKSDKNRLNQNVLLTQFQVWLITLRRKMRPTAESLKLILKHLRKQLPLTSAAETIRNTTVRSNSRDNIVGGQSVVSLDPAQSKTTFQSGTNRATLIVAGESSTGNEKVLSSVGPLDLTPSKDAIVRKEAKTIVNTAAQSNPTEVERNLSSTPPSSTPKTILKVAGSHAQSTNILVQKRAHPVSSSVKNATTNNAPESCAAPPIVCDQIHDTVNVTARAPAALEIDLPAVSVTDVVVKDKSSPSETTAPAPCISNGTTSHVSNVEVKSASR